MIDPFYPFDWLAAQIVRALGLSLDSRLGESLHFFLYDVPKVLVLILAIGFVVGTFQSFLQPDRVQAWTRKQPPPLGNALAAAIGTVTPFCSCSAVPLFVGFLSAGVPLGVTFSYLIAAPMVNEVAVVLLWGLFGLRAVALYAGLGVVLAIAAGYLLGRLNLEPWVEPFVLELRQQRRSAIASGQADGTGAIALPAQTWGDRLAGGWDQAREIASAVWPYVVAGIGIGAIVHGYVPADLVARVAGADNPLAVPIAVALGVPLYANIAGVLPIAEALTGKGLPLGTVLAFVMAVTALSFPEMVILRKVLKPRLLATFVGITTAGIVATGFIFNRLL